MCQALMLVLACLARLAVARNDACDVCVCFDFDDEMIVDCTGAGLVSVPPNVPANTTILNLRSNQFDSLPRASFATAPSVKQLFLSDNGMTAVDDGAFIGLPNLELLDLSVNMLVRLSGSAFDNPSPLETLEIRQNRLTSLDGSSLALGGLRSLKHIDASLNHISTTSSLASLAQLSTLKLRGNQLNSLEVGLVDSNAAMVHLDLSANRLSLVEPASFHGLTALKTLKLNDNFLNALPLALFTHLTNISEINLADNFLASVPTALFSGLTLLSRLNLANNALQSLPGTDILADIDIVHIGGRNKFNCCEIQWLRNSSIVQDLPAVVCDRPQRVRGKALSSIQGNVAVCSQDVPDAPSQLSMDAVLSRSLRIKFPAAHGNAVETASYTVEYSTLSTNWTRVSCAGGQYPLNIGALPGPSTSCTFYQRHPTTQVYIDPIVVPVTDLIPYTNYTFRVAAHNAFGTSSKSEQWSTQTYPDRPGPVEAPLLVASDARSATVHSMRPNSPNGVIIKTVFTVVYTRSAESYESTSPNITLTDLMPYTIYNITALPFTVVGSGTTSPPLQLRTEQAAPALAPTLATIYASSTMINVSWIEVALPEANGIITGYLVVDATTNATVCNTTSLNCTVSTVVPGTTYELKLAASTSAGDGPMSASHTVRTLDAVPDGLTNPHVDHVSSQSVNLSWTVPTQPNGAIIKYEISAITDQIEQLVEVDGDVQHHRLAGLKPAANYSFKLRAYTSLGASNYTDAVLVTMLEAAPAQLAMPVMLSSNARGVTLQWSPPVEANGNLTKYTVYQTYKQRNQSFYPFEEVTESILLAEFRPTTSSGVIESLEPAVSYQLAMTASTAAGESVLSVPITLTTRDDVPSRPGLPAIQVLTPSSAYIQWTQPGEPRGNLIKYQVLLDGETVAYETATVNPASLNTTLYGLNDNTLYEVTVVAYTSAGASIPSLEAKLKTPKDKVDITPIIVIIVVVLFVLVLSIGYSYERANRLRSVDLKNNNAAHPTADGIALRVLPHLNVADHSAVNMSRRETITEELESGSSDEEAVAVATTPFSSTPRKAFAARPPPPSGARRALPPVALSSNRGISLPANVPKPSLRHLPSLK
eukprot:m.3560 g.3560  ORF g.3560 m.3560 type:complete len:1103 (+) comp6007_c0_seq1:66-3374(+)